jgi:hypothetical protein
MQPSLRRTTRFRRAKMKHVPAMPWPGAWNRHSGPASKVIASACQMHVPRSWQANPPQRRPCRSASGRRLLDRHMCSGQGTRTTRTSRVSGTFAGILPDLGVQTRRRNRIASSRQKKPDTHVSGFSCFRSRQSSDQPLLTDRRRPKTNTSSTDPSSPGLMTHWMSGWIVMFSVRLAK